MITEFVESLTDEQRRQIVADYDQFEQEGAIGDCVMRTCATQMLDAHGIGRERFVMWMRDLTFEVLRHFYRQHQS